jgi:hypothetical protein
MIYFRKVFFDLPVTHQQVERGLRKVAAKRLTSLDFKSSTSDFKSDKYFLGLEGRKDIKFTRVRTSLERLVPKIIISLSKNTDQNYYRLRLTWGWAFFFMLLALVLLLTIYGAIAGSVNTDGLFATFGFCIVYIGLVFWEMERTNSKVNKAVKTVLIDTAE